MAGDFQRKVPGLSNVARTAEWLARNVLLVSFLALLLLVGFLGYWTRESISSLEYEIETIRDIELNHDKVVNDLKDTADKMNGAVSVLMSNMESSMMHMAARRKVEDLKRDMEAHIESGRKTSLVDTQEWKEFEAAFGSYLNSINIKGAGVWNEERDRMMGAIEGLDDVVRREREVDNRRTKELGRAENRKVVTGAVAVLILGFLVAALTFYEIRKVLKQLGKSYRESSEARDYLQSLLDSLVSGVVVIGQDGRVQTISDSFKRLPGTDVDDPLEKNYKDVFNNHPSLVEEVSKHLNKKTDESKYLGRVKLGGERLFEVFASPLKLAEEQRGLILVFVDITDAARAQSELRRNRALTAVGQMTAQIAHEIKNPLGSIRFATEVLRRQRPSSDGSNLETIEVIERSVDHLAAIVAELSEFARPKELNRSNVNMNELLGGLVPMVADRLNAKAVRINESFTTPLQEGQYDETELRKLFLNLIINAIDASSAGGLIELRTKTNGKREIMVEIEDHGTGMDEETLRRLYEPFYTTKEKGTGLGMAIAKKIAELHRGDLTVRSTLGQGTTVTVRLPLS